MKLFDRFSVEGVEVKDPGLRRVIDLEPRLLLKSHGRDRKEFSKARVNVVERLIRLLQVPGSRGKKHKIMTSWSSGKYYKNAMTVIKTFEAIEKKTGSNPVEVFVRAIENASPRDGVTAIEYGGARYPQATDISPLKRLNLALKHFVHGGYDKAFNKKTTIVEGLTKEIISASESSSESFAVQKKNDIEKQADAAR